MSRLLILRMLAWATSNSVSQRGLEHSAALCHYLMGIGSGAPVEVSGEKAVLRTLARRYSGPVCIVDGGANNGQFLHIALAAFVGNPIEVHCFEPSLKAFSKLSGERFGENVSLNRVALGKHEGTACLFSDNPGSGLASLTKRDLSHLELAFEYSEEIQVTTLDAYCENRGIEKVDLLKLDLEGHEHDALSGASRMFSKKAIGAVLFEFGGCNIDTGSYFRDLFQFLKGHGMSIFRVCPSGYLRPLPAYRERDEQFRTTNFLAVLDAMGCGNDE